MTVRCTLSTYRRHTPSFQLTQLVYYHSCVQIFTYHISATALRYKPNLSTKYLSTSFYTKVCMWLNIFQSTSSDQVVPCALSISPQYCTGMHRFVVSPLQHRPKTIVGSVAYVAEFECRPTLEKHSCWRVAHYFDQDTLPLIELRTGMTCLTACMCSCVREIN